MSDRSHSSGEKRRQCPSWETLVDLTYDELEPAHASRVRAHIESCEACTETFKELLEFLKLAGTLPGAPVSPSPEVAERLREEVRKQRPLLRRWLEVLRRLATAPLPAYQVVLVGAVLALVFQFLVPGNPARIKELAEQLAGAPPPPAIVGSHQAGVVGPAVFPDVAGERGEPVEPTATPTPAVEH